MSFTKGPWRLEKWKNGFLIYAPEKLSIVAEKIEKEANANLIAAAPDLLEAARWAVGMGVNKMLELEQMKGRKTDIGEPIDDKLIDIYIEHWDIIRKKCSDAILKAEGKEK